MAAPQGLNDLRLFLNARQIDDEHIRIVLLQYLEENKQTDSAIFQDHQVWDYRNTIAQFAKLLNDEPIDDDESEQN